MRLQRKFLALLLPAGLVAASLILFLIHRSVHSILVGDLEKNVLVVLQSSISESQSGFESKSEAMLLPELQSLQKQEGALYAEAVDTQGAVLAHTTITEKGKTERDPMVRQALESLVPVISIRQSREGPVAEIAVPVWSEQKAASGDAFLLSGESREGPKSRLGFLRMGVSLNSVQETESRIIRNIFLIVAAIGGLSLALVVLLVRGILRPITGLMAGIAGIGRGEYDVKVPVLSEDELGDLAASFNGMSEALARTTVSKEYVEGILETMADMLVVAGPDGKIETINHAAIEALGYGAEEAAGLPIASLFHEDEPAFHGRSVLELLKAGEVRDMEVALKTKSGSDIPALFSASVFRDRLEVLQGYVCVAKDITERKRAEEALLRAKTAAETASKELEAFSYSVAHDLRAPLRAIDGFSQILLENYSSLLDAEGQSYLKRVGAGSRRMGQLIDDLLNLSRITRSVMRRENVDLSALAREIADDLRKAQPERNVEFVIAEDLTAEGDPNLLRVLLVNLLNNAWKYTGKHAHARIEFGRTVHEGKQAFFVRDDGAGFDMAHSKKLFQAFNRLHTITEFEGTGIGLATVQRVVERHGGRIWGRGEVERGATFYFTLKGELKNESEGDDTARRG